MPVVSSYTPITGANVGTGDDFLIVDVSDTTQAATGTTKRITREELPSALGLGKYVAVGYGGNPTWIDPAATGWADVVANDFGWVQFEFDGVGTGSTKVGAGAANVVNVTASASSVGSNVIIGAAQALAQVVGTTATVAASGSGGTAQIEGSDTHASAIVYGITGQTEDLLHLENGAGTPIVAVTEDGYTLIGNRATAAGAGADLSLEAVRNFTDPNVAVQQAFSAYGAFFGTPGGSSGPLVGGTSEALVYNNGSGDVTVAVCGFEGIGRVDGDNGNKVAEAIGVQATVVIQGAQGATDLIALSVPPVSRDGGTGTVTNAYGAKIFAPTVGTNKWSLYVDGRTQLDYLDFGERTAPASPPADTARLYTKDVGGKTGLYVLFPTGVEQQIKVQA